MSAIDVISIAIGVTGVAFGANSYRELWRWAKQCQNARIVVAHNRRVQINAPLTDWLGWSNQLSGEQKETGRVVYRNAKTSVAILRPKQLSTWRKTLLTVRKVRKRGTDKAPGA